MAEQLICNQQVAGSSPITSSNHGRVPEWPKGADCKSAVADFGGSNPPPSTSRRKPVYSKANDHTREWRNWQTRTVQVRVSASSCRFKSCFSHQQNPTGSWPLGFFHAHFFLNTTFLPTDESETEVESRRKSCLLVPLGFDKFIHPGR